jgi:hypothetical protein
MFFGVLFEFVGVWINHLYTLRLATKFTPALWNRVSMRLCANPLSYIPTCKES